MFLCNKLSVSFGQLCVFVLALLNADFVLGVSPQQTDQEQPQALELAENPESPQPNILFILTDDQAPWALGRSGHPHATTPNLDRLVDSGMYLTRSFVTTPVCSPSRASLMTSRYGSEVGITDWINPRLEPELGLDPELTTWPELLQEAGYRTGLVGKWHLGVPDRYHPTENGYESFMGFLTGGMTTSDPVLEINGRNQQFEGLTADILTDHAIEFLQTKDDRPFLLCMHYRAPHTQWLPVSDEDWAPFENLDPTIPNPLYPNLDVERVKRMTREYLASTHSVDRNVGRILECLDEERLGANTIVIFSSDHGYSMGHNGIWHKGNGHWVLREPPPFSENIPRNQRPNMYDLSLNVPTIVRWPGVVEPGSMSEKTVSNLDWFPTLLAMANVELPSDVVIRGRSILPVLQQERGEWDNDFFGQYSTHHQSTTHMRALRTPEWKFVRDFLNEGRDELYNLINDPEESQNLIDSDLPEVLIAIEELQEKLMSQMEAISDPALSLDE